MQRLNLITPCVGAASCNAAVLLTKMFYTAAVEGLPENPTVIDIICQFIADHDSDRCRDVRDPALMSQLDAPSLRSGDAFPL